MEAKLASARPLEYRDNFSLWNVFHDLKSIVDHPVVDKYVAPILIDDSGRLVNMTEIYPNLFIGDEGAAKNKFYLKKIGVTHVLNSAEGSQFGNVDIDQAFYKSFGIKYKGLQLVDVPHCNIAMYFSESSEFIEEGLKNGGKVLVNCFMGISRSSTCVLAFLMMKRNMTAAEALTTVRRYREVHPNDGFLRQLADLDNKLRRERNHLQ